MKLKTLSASRIKDWLKCKRYYTYRNHFKYEEDVEPTLIYGGIGHVAHHCLGKSTIDGSHPHKWLSEGIDAYQHELKLLNMDDVDRIKRMIDCHSLITQLRNASEEIVAERRFWVKLDSRYDFMLHGFIDLLGRKGDSIIIVDWKTIKPSRQPTDTQLLSESQLMLYAVAASAMYNVPSHKVKSGMYFLENKRMGIANTSIQNTDAWKRWVLNVADSIIAADPERVPASPSRDVCKWCEYRVRCKEGAALMAGRY